MDLFSDALKPNQSVYIPDTSPKTGAASWQADPIFSPFHGPHFARTTEALKKSVHFEDLDPRMRTQPIFVDWEHQMFEDGYASRPFYQFKQQVKEENERISEARRNGVQTVYENESPSTVAVHIVEERWIKQGIWDDDWLSMGRDARWKHEQPLDLESETEVDPEAPEGLFGQKWRRFKSREERQKIAQRRFDLECERSSSRPFNQFIYQVAQERERLHDDRGGLSNFENDINTLAYNTIKELWIRRNIWMVEWGVMPGMSWKHEKPRNGSVAEGHQTGKFAKDTPRTGFSFDVPPVHAEDHTSTAARDDQSSNTTSPLTVCQSADENNIHHAESITKES